MSGQSFPQDVVAGTQLVTPSIHSPNFLTGVTGWTINLDGSAEFNNLTIRGTFSGTDFIINSTGIFFYNGVPGSGNSPYFWAVASGVTVDPFGNHVQGAMGIGNPSGAHTEFEGGGNANFNDSSNNTRVHIEPGSDLIAVYPAGGASSHAPDITIADTSGTDEWGHSFPAGINIPTLPLSAGDITGSTFNGTDFVINGSGAFFYSGTPANGNLIASISRSSGTDAFSNSYQAGVTSYNASGYAQLSGAQINFQQGSGTPAGTLAADSAGGLLALTSGTSSGLDTASYMSIIGSSETGIGIESLIIQNGQVGIPAGSGPFVPGEGFHGISGAAGLSGTFRVKLLPWNAVWFDGEGTFTYTGASQTFTMGNFPSASYYPTASRHFPVAVTGTPSGVTGSFPRLFIPTSGGPQLIVPSGTGTSAPVGWSIIFPNN